MTAHRIPNDYYAPDGFSDRNNTKRVIQRNNSNTGVITNKTKSGSYNIVEKDFGDHKVIYHIPVEYGDDYDVSQIEETPIIEERQQQQQHTSPRLVRRRIYQEYDNYDYDDDDDGYEYVEEIPISSPRRRVYVSPRRQTRDVQVIQRVYEPQPIGETVEYIYEDDYPDNHNYRREKEEEVEYVVRERVPKQTYMEESRPPRRTVHVQDPPIPVYSPRPPVSYSPRRSPHSTVVSHQPSPRTFITERSPSPIPLKPNRRNDLSPSLTNRKQQTARSPIDEAPSRSNIPHNNEPPPLRLMDIIAENRAKRGAGIPKPRREIDEAKVYDPPTYNRNIIKNGFIVHK